MTGSPDQFTKTVTHFVHRSAYTPGQLAMLSSIPKMTIVNWLIGRVQRPRGWQRIVALATAMRLTEAEADELLASALQPSIDELRQTVKSSELALLGFWQTAVATPHITPFQAIPLPPYFVGRESILVTLNRLLCEKEQTAVYCLHGMAGVGKTSLAARVAYQVSDQFEDGVLWAKLDSSDTMSILATFAAAYQRDVSQFHDVASRSRVVRELLMPKRTLIVLDNAQTSAQIEPLLPPTGQCAVLVTTRRQDLAILAGAKRFEIRPFSANDSSSLKLFSQILGDERTQKDKKALQQISASLGHLPLALVITASRLAYEQGWETVQFERRLQKERRRLSTLQYENESVRRSFNMTFDHLTHEVQRLFSAAGVLANETFSVEAIASLLVDNIEVIEDGLRQLCALSLLQRLENGRFFLHPLLHDFAHSLPRDVQFEQRLVEHWQQFTDWYANDFNVLRQEMEHIERALETAVRLEMKRPLAKMLTHLMPYFISVGAHPQAEHHLHQAQTLFKTAGDEIGLGWAYLGLGQIMRQRQQLTQAETYLKLGLQLAEKHEDRKQLTRFLTELGIVYNCMGEYEQGAAYLTKALPLARQEPPNVNLLNLLEEMGILSVLKNDGKGAASYYEEGIKLATQSGFIPQQVMFLKGLGALRHLAQDRAAALALFSKGYALAQGVAYRKGMMVMENNLGVVAFFEQEMVKAERYLKMAMVKAENLLDFQGLRLILDNVARLQWHNGRISEAESTFAQILTLAKKQGWQQVEEDIRAQIATLQKQPHTVKAQHLKVFI